MSKQPRVVITERAEADLDEIGDYIAAEADEDRAEAVLRKIAEKNSTSRYPAFKRPAASFVKTGDAELSRLSLHRLLSPPRRRYKGNPCATRQPRP